MVLLIGMSCVPTVGMASIGLFQESRDAGDVAKAGSVELRAEDGSFLVAGGGENMWFTNDAFHFAWTRVSGDFALKAAVEFIGGGGNAHRKACLMVRESLSPDSAYVDVAVHGDGLTSLQFREKSGGLTGEIQANTKSPKRVG